MTLVAGKQPHLLFTGDDDEVFMTSSFNLTPKTTKQTAMYALVNLKPQ